MKRITSRIHILWFRLKCWLMGRTPFIGIDPAYGDDYGCEIIGYKDRKGVFYIIEERFFVRGDDTPQKVDFREQWDQCRYTWGNGKWE